MALKGRVSIDFVYCRWDSEVRLCWVKGKEICWKPWVENRVVSIRNIIDKDSWEEIISRVPQGSILGPLLSNIFLHDLFLFFENYDLSNYADDNTLYSSGK